MTTQIAGPGPLFTQTGTGTTPGYSALDLRRSELIAPTQEGVLAGGDYQVTQRAAGGAALFVDIAAGSGAFACVQGDSLTGQGLYVVGPHSAAVITEAIAAPDVTNPRIDIAVLEVFDNTLDASGLNIARVRIIAGSPTAGTTLNSRAGVAALPGSALLLADILVTAGAASVSNTQIRDRRKWARGAFGSVATSANGNNFTSTPTDTGLYSLRLECSGAPLRIDGVFQVGTNTAGAVAYMLVVMDGVEQTRGAVRTEGTGVYVSCVVTTVQAVAAGSHVFTVNGITPAVGNLASGFLSFLTVEEVVRANRSNGVLTSG